MVRGNGQGTTEELHDVLVAARTEQQRQDWKDKYALRAGVEGTIAQALAVTGIRHARYRRLPKVRLQHAFSAAAINVVRLDAHWADRLPGRARTSRLARLHQELAA